MTPKKPRTDTLDAFFDAAAARPAEADPAFLARIVADADAEQARFRTKAPAARTGGGLGGWLARAFAPVPAAWTGAMAACLGLGIWVGYADLGQVSDLASAYLGSASTGDDMYSALLALDLEG